MDNERLNEIKEKIRVYDKYLDQTDLNITEEDLGDFYWLVDTLEQQNKQIQELESEISVLKNINNSI